MFLKVQATLMTLLVFTILNHDTWGVVNAPNPFLRPGSNQKPPPQKNTKYKPRPVPQKDMSREIEFRGYFIFQGRPFFCLFNKKSNRGEWISLSELTYEEFEAYEFNEQTETLTVKYEGITYEITLIQGGSSVASPAPPSVKAPSVTSPAATSTGNTPKYMPPRPTKTPALPAWLVNRKSPPVRSSSSGGSANGMIPRRTNPMSFNVPSRTENENPSSSTNFGSNPSSVTRTVTSSSGAGASTSSGTQIIETPGNDFPQNFVENDSNGNDLDLENLPPPPPPPNIVPPTPPPNILPSREN